MTKLTILFITLLPLMTFASEWKLVKEKDGIKIFAKESTESPIKTLKAVGLINARIENVVAILRDVKSASSWIPNLIERRYIRNISDTEAILFDVSDMPWPVQDRELIVHHKLTLSEDRKSLELNFNSVDDNTISTHIDRVRAKFNLGKITFTPKGEQTTIDLEILVDPKGAIPKWLVNILQVSMPYDFLNSLNIYASSTQIKPLPGILKLILQLKRK